MSSFQHGDKQTIVDSDTAKESYVSDVLKKANFTYGVHPFNSLSDKEQAAVQAECKEQGVSLDAWCEMKRSGKL